MREKDLDLRRTVDNVIEGIVECVGCVLERDSSDCTSDTVGPDPKDAISHANNEWMRRRVYLESSD